MAIKADTRQLADYALRLRGLGSRSADRVGAALERIGIYLVNYVKTRKLSGDPIKRRTGNLSRHIGYTVTRVGKGVSLRVGLVRGDADVPYGKYLEHGSKPHLIHPKNKKALAFKLGNADGKVVVRSVKHPGTRAYHFLRDSLTENREYITKQVKKAVSSGTES